MDFNLRKEYKIQEYSGRTYKNPATMAKSLNNDQNWYDHGGHFDNVIAASTRLREMTERYGKYNRRFRIVSRPIHQWRIEQPV